MYIETRKDTETMAIVSRILSIAGMSYRGTQVEVNEFKGTRLDSAWCDGSRTTLAIVNYATGKAAPVPENGTMFCPSIGELTSLPDNCLVVKHRIFRGKDMGIELLVPASFLAKLLPDTPTLTPEQMVVLYATRSLKSSYGGIPNYRFHQAHEETGITKEQWEQAKGELIDARLLNKAGAITPSGRNAVGKSFDWPNLGTTQACA